MVGASRVDRICTDDRFGPALAADLRALFDGHRPGRRWPSYLIGGI